MSEIRIRSLSELDLDGITRIDERITGRYRPDVWEERVTYYIRRDAEASQVAEADGKVAGFMLGEVRGGEFGLEESTGWLDFMGVDPDARGKRVGARLADALLAHFRAKGALVARTMVREEDEQILGFVRSIGFAPAKIASLEKRL